MNTGKTKRRRRGVRTVLAMLLLLCLLPGMLAGCGADGGQGSDPTQDTPGGKTPAPDSDKAFPATVLLRDVEMTMHADAAPALAALGEWKNYVAKESCAFVGQDKEYTYNGFLLMTYPDGKTDRISSVILTSDAVTTGEGLYIGGDESMIEGALGSDCKKENGSYLYKSASAQLLILTEGGKITSIQYSAVLES